MQSTKRFRSFIGIQSGICGVVGFELSVPPLNARPVHPTTGTMAAVAMAPAGMYWASESFVCSYFACNFSVCIKKQQRFLESISAVFFVNFQNKTVIYTLICVFLANSNN
ncbi:hypothetical protein CYJ36_17800 [Bacillus sp. UMB0893]|nr:hypothetical protein CYJ36_17800 [Bacillus sp. UMB0893]